jgi:hypothetical protein
VVPAHTLCAMADYETRRFSRVEYDKLIDLGVFQPGEAIELLGGHLVVAEPQGAAHYTAIVKTARALQAAFGAAWYVRTQGPIGLDDESEPEPDAEPRGWRARDLPQAALRRGGAIRLELRAKQRRRPNRKRHAAGGRQLERAGVAALALMQTYFAVRRRRGPAWNASVPLRAQIL